MYISIKKICIILKQCWQLLLAIGFYILVQYCQDKLLLYDFFTFILEWFCCYTANWNDVCFETYFWNILGNIKALQLKFEWNKTSYAKLQPVPIIVMYIILYKYKSSILKFFSEMNTQIFNKKFIFIRNS